MANSACTSHLRCIPGTDELADITEDFHCRSQRTAHGTKSRPSVSRAMQRRGYLTADFWQRNRVGADTGSCPRFLYILRALELGYFRRAMSYGFSDPFSAAPPSV